MIWNPRLAKKLSQIKGPVPWHNPADKLVKHASPIHPGTGTDQSVHGQGRLFDPGPVARPKGDDFAKVVGAWPVGHSYKVEAETKEAISRVYQRMTEDPRWEDARDEWSQLEYSRGSDELDDMYADAENLVEQFETWAGEGGVDLGFEELATPWEAYDYIESHSVDYGDDLGNFETIEDLLQSDANLSGEYWTSGIEGSNSNDPLKITAVGEKDSLEEGQVELDHFQWVDVTTLEEVGYDYRYTIESGYTRERILEELSSLDQEWGVFENDFNWDPPTAIRMVQDGYGPEEFGLDIMADEDHFFVNDSFEGEGREDADPNYPEAGPKLLRNLWANTAADDHGWALAVQRAVADEFGLEYSLHSGHSIEALELSDRVYENYGTYLRTWARAVYDETQADLTERGWDYIPVARGMRVDFQHDDLFVYRSPVEGSSWHYVEADLNPISSFTTRLTTARGFGDVLYVTWVPKEKVWGHSLLGNGAISEEEVIVLGGNEGFHGYATQWSFMVTNDDGTYDYYQLDPKTLEFSEKLP